MKIPFDIPRTIRSTHAKKIDKYIEIAGSSNYRLNSMSEDSQLSLLRVLSKHYTKVAITIVNNKEDLDKLVAKNPDLVVLGVKLILLDHSKSYDNSPKLWLSSHLKQHSINFTGSEASAMKLEFNKHEAKQRVINMGLRSSSYTIAKINHTVAENSLRFPLFVKPTNQGDSKGIDENSVVHTRQDLDSKVASVHNDFGSDALIEEYLPGREFSVAVINKPHSDELLAMPIELTSAPDKNGNSFLSKAVKDSDSEKVLAVMDQDLRNKINTLAMGVFTALGARDYGRIDMRLDKNGLPSFIEANLMPGLSDHGYLSRCFFLNEQVNYEDMILSIISLSFERAVDPPAVTAALDLVATTVDNSLLPVRVGA